MFKLKIISVGKEKRKILKNERKIKKEKRRFIGQI